jgi:hypothetical protein
MTGLFSSAACFEEGDQILPHPGVILRVANDEAYSGPLGLLPHHEISHDVEVVSIALRIRIVDRRRVILQSEADDSPGRGLSPHLREVIAGQPEDEIRVDGIVGGVESNGLEAPLRINITIAAVMGETQASSDEPAAEPMVKWAGADAQEDDPLAAKSG